MRRVTHPATAIWLLNRDTPPGLANATISAHNLGRIADVQKQRPGMHQVKRSARQPSPGRVGLHELDLDSALLGKLPSHLEDPRLAIDPHDVTLIAHTSPQEMDDAEHPTANIDRPRPDGKLMSSSSCSASNAYTSA